MRTKRKLTGILSFLLVFTIIASSTFTAFGAAGKWIKSGNRWWYRHNDSSYTTNDWEKINNKWYHFDKNGWMQTGWLKVSGKWYYLNANGDMATGWRKVSGKWYYLNAKGDMATGWKKVNGDWYYLNPNGDMATGWKKVGSNWYYLDEDGVMLTDFIYDNNNMYYLKSNGAMVTGWYEVEGDWYYFSGSGAMAYNRWVGNNYVNYYGIWIEDTKLTFGSSIAMGMTYICEDSEDLPIRYTDDETVMNSFKSYASTLDVTVKQIDFDTNGWIYDIVLLRSEEDFDNIMILEDEGILFYDGTMYEVDSNVIAGFWNSCTELPQ